MTVGTARRPLTAALALGLAALAGCGTGPQAPPPTAPATVTIGQVKAATVSEQEFFTGRTEAKEAVEVKARATGYLLKVNFKEGDLVEKGQLLFEIDPRTYAAELAKAEADVKRNKATLGRQRSELNRARRLSAGDAISREEYDRIAASAEETQAAVASAQATADRQRLSLEFCRVLAPIAGRISRAQVTAGNLVTADVTVLTTIVSLDPIYAYFDVDERTVLRVQKMIRQGEYESAREGKRPPVYLGTQAEKGYPHKGTIDFVENRVDPGTGTLRVRGVFPNPPVGGGGKKSPVLTPGLAVRIRVPIGRPRERVLVPDSVLGSDQGRRFVYVVNHDNVVERRMVEVGRLAGGKRPVEEGLEPGEWIITNGMQRVRPGATVNPTRAAMPER